MLSTLLLLASAIGQAQFNLVTPLQVSETLQVQLGDIANYATATCRVILDQRVGEACISSEWASGAIQVIAAKGESISVQLTSITDPNIHFTPLLSNGSQVDFYVVDNGLISIPIGGEITLINPSSFGHHTVSYLVEINYE